ncbi:hypothetical protein N5K37_32690 [Delftia tsuruhatensis]|nr:hypothetical protein [Delftia tsuruhatensis]MDH2234670.1 hypothetical protein [Delftia tsuruhatensis]
MKRDLNLTVPVELRQAEELLERYGRWAQDRYKKQRCASAEGKYVPPPLPMKDREEPMEPFMPDWSAMQVQRALQVVPMQFRRILLALYIPQKEHPNAARRRMNATNQQWHQGRINGLRSFWSSYSRRDLRGLTDGAIIATTYRDTESCAPVT